MHARLILVGLVTALAVSSTHAQVASFAVRPSVVDAGGYYNIHYTFTAGTRGFASGGGVRIEIPVAYAETEALLWSAPQTVSARAPGYVSASASNKARIRVQIAGLLRGIIEAVSYTHLDVYKRQVQHRSECLLGVIGKTIAGQQRSHTDPVVQQEVQRRSQGATPSGARHGRGRRGTGLHRQRALAGALGVHLAGVLQVARFDLQPGTERFGTIGHQRTSKMPAAPMPPPMHMVTHTRWAPRRRPSIRA